jgi:hypothetical protein
MHLTFLSSASSIGPTMEARTRVFVTLTPTERREVESALARIEPVSKTAAVVLRRVLDSAPPAGSDDPVVYASVGRAARFYGVTSQTIRNWIDRGLIPAHVTPGGTRLISTEGWDRVRAFRRAGRRNPGSMTEEQVAYVVEHFRDDDLEQVLETVKRMRNQ